MTVTRCYYSITYNEFQYKQDLLDSKFMFEMRGLVQSRLANGYPKDFYYHEWNIIEAFCILLTKTTVMVDQLQFMTVNMELWNLVLQSLCKRLIVNTFIVNPDGCHQEPLDRFLNNPFVFIENVQMTHNIGY